MLKYSQVRRQAHLLVVLMHIQMFVRGQSVQSQTGNIVGTIKFAITCVTTLCKIKNEISVETDSRVKYFIWQPPYIYLETAT